MQQQLAAVGLGQTREGAVGGLFVARVAAAAGGREQIGLVRGSNVVARSGSSSAARISANLSNELAQPAPKFCPMAGTANPVWRSSRRVSPGCPSSV